MSEPENRFPTIADYAERLAELVTRGLGDLPAQILVVPDSTMQAIARDTDGFDGKKPALLIELTGKDDSSRIPVCLISADRYSGHGMPTLITQ